ncbi:DgyrCDS1876 [Dimorphilus gyrociliatus]|nr:DgyrCDS1876 [Dimorphilus gyrociliatus]
MENVTHLSTMVADFSDQIIMEKHRIAETNDQDSAYIESSKLNDLSTFMTDKFQTFDRALNALRNEFEHFKEDFNSKNSEKNNYSLESRKFEEAVIDFDKEIDSKTSEIIDLNEKIRVLLKNQEENKKEYENLKADNIAKEQLLVKLQEQNCKLCENTTYLENEITILTKKLKHGEIKLKAKIKRISLMNEKLQQHENRIKNDIYINRSHQNGQIQMI